MDSLINQTYEHIEILVIDDCSTDNSMEVLTKYKSHPKVKLILREQNGGWVMVSNQGVELSSGEFVLFANCDDACDPEMIQHLVKAMSCYSTAGIAFCRSFMVNEQDVILGDDYSMREYLFKRRCLVDTLVLGSEMSRFLLHSCVIPNLSAALFRREIFFTVGFLSPSYKVCCDWEFFFRIVACYDVAYVTQPLNRFRQHATTIRSTTRSRVIFEEYFRLLLGQLKLQDLTFIESSRLRVRVMYLWATHIISPSKEGMSNFLYHLRCIVALDVLVLPFIVVGLLQRLALVIARVFGIRRYS